MLIILLLLKNNNNTYNFPSASMAVLLALIKTTTSLLLKTSLRLHRMLTEDVEEVCWPRDCQEKGKWIGEKLAYLIINSEEILAKCVLKIKDDFLLYTVFCS